ncbi:MAG: hypothetical protein ACKVZJ_02380 [Phycisphaerales bacterium]
MGEPSFNRPHGPITFGELTAGLVWPRMLRALPMSLRPSRMLLGMVGVLGMIGAAKVVTLLTEAARADGTRPRGVGERVLVDIGDGVGGAAAALLRLDVGDAASSLELASTALSVHGDRWGALALSMALMLPIWLLVGGAAARSSVLEFAGQSDVPLRRAVVFALLRMGVLMRALLLPLFVAALVSVGLKIGGWALFSLPGVSVVGALLYPVAFVGGVVLVLVWVGFALGHWLLAPAVAAENSDATDAVQRAFSYVLGRPSRTLAYFALAALLGAVGFVVVSWVTGHAEGLTRAGLSSWLSAERAGVVATPSGRAGASAWIVSAWVWVIGLIPAAWGLSYAFTASSVLYLLLRRVHDEQDASEVWGVGKG